MTITASDSSRHCSAMNTDIDSILKALNRRNDHVCILWRNFKRSYYGLCGKIDNYVIVIKNVPCKKCNQCGEEYFSTPVAKKIESILDGIQKISSEITVTVIDYPTQAA